MPHYFICTALEMVNGAQEGIIQFGLHSAHNDFDRHRNRIKENLKAELHRRHPNLRIDVLLLEPKPTTAEEYTKQAKQL